MKNYPHGCASQNLVSIIPNTCIQSFLLLYYQFTFNNTFPNFFACQMMSYREFSSKMYFIPTLQKKNHCYAYNFHVSLMQFTYVP